MKTPSTEGRIYQGLTAEGRSAERRQRLLDAAVTVYGQQGYHAATVSAICEAAGLTKRYFYQEFASQEELLCAVYQAIMAEIRALVERVGSGPKPFAERVLDTAAAYFTFISEHPAQARIMLLEMEGVSAGVNAVTGREIAATAEVLRHQLFTAPHAPQARPDLLAVGILGAIYQLAKGWITASDTQVRPTLDEMATQVQLLCLGVSREVEAR